MMKLAPASALICGGIASFAAADHASAQLVLPDEAMDTIVVTSRLRTEELQDVPIQITVFSDQDLINAGVRTTQDFINLTPNVTLDDAFTYLNTYVTVRGLQQLNEGPPPIAIVVDGVPQNTERQLKMNLFDIEQIEVLRGPQGAFYGRNSVAGAFNIVTKQPTNEFEGFVSALYGTGDQFETTAGFSGPIIKDKVLFRVAGSYAQDDGRIDNVFLDEKVDTVDHDYNIRGRLLMLPTDWLKLDARVAYNDFEAGALYDSFVFTGDSNDFFSPTSNLLGSSEGSIFESTFKADADLGFAVLTSITGYTDFNEDFLGDLDFSNALNNSAGGFGLGPVGQDSQLDVKLFSQEVRLVSNQDSRLRWLVGGFYLKTDREKIFNLFQDLDGTLEQAENPSLFAFDSDEDNENDAWSVYGQFDFDITDRLTLSAGLRYDEDDRSQDAILNRNAPAPDFITRDASFDALQPSVTISYDALPNAQVYASYAEGFRPGGFTSATDPFDEEEVRNIEGGFKSQWMNNRLILNGAFYYAFVDNYQFFFLSLEAGGQVISNIDEVDIYGVELEAQAVLTDYWSAYASIGTTNTEIQADDTFPNAVGNKTPRTTEYTFNLGSQYRPPLFDDVFGFLRVDFERRGDRYWQLDNADIQQPLNLLNVRVGLETDTWGLYAWGRNILDEEYYADFTPTEFSGLVDFGFPAQPAVYGLEARLRF